mmetsp:Transcript_24641/g.39050  ORF Transcript_24641/g.39050 Transcript_24641/m.39050 type:complete len:133 (+) Transcript_24641:14-412(+)
MEKDTNNSTQSLQFRRQLDANAEKIIHNLAGIVRNAKITNETESYLQSVNISLHTTNLLEAVESMMRQIQELKLSAILQDMDSLNAETETNSRALQQRAAQAEELINQLSHYWKASMEESINNSSIHHHNNI